MGPSGVTVEPAPGACSSDLHSRLIHSLLAPGSQLSVPAILDPGTNKGEMTSAGVRASLRRGFGGGTEGAERCR